MKSDFSTVRVHTDERAARATDALDADAFAVGNDIFFARSRFAPSTPGGRELLAHELAHVRQNQMRPTGGLGQPTIQRRVRPNFVSCQGYPRTYPIFTAIGTTDPVPMVEAADRRAIEMLDDVIGELQHARDAIVNGAPAAWPTVSDVVAGALQNRFGIDPSDTAVWTGTGEGTVRVIIRRYEAIRRVLQGGWVHYTCLGANCGTEWAYVTGPNYVVNLCRLWWRSPDSDERALTLIHELLHVYFWSFMGDTGALGNAHRYDQFLSDIQ